MDDHEDKPWDDSLRSLLRANPQAFVSLVLSDAQFKRELPHKLKTWKQEVDGLVDVVCEGQEMLVHFEFQTYNDPTMAERMLRYNVLIRGEYGLPVLSCVIYLLRDGNVPVSLLHWTVPTGQEVLQFHFESIELGKWSPEDLLQKGEAGLLPLLPLTKGGASREVTNTTFADLEAVGHPELISIGGTLASLMFSRENTADLDWLHRRLHAMHNLLRESPYFQEILQEGREEGLEEGLEKGLKEGKVEGLREMLLTLVQARFPKILRLTQGLATVTEDPEVLKSLILKMSIARTLKEARQILFEVGEDNSN